MEKKITVNGKEYNMRATALIPRQYRNRFGRDLIVDMKKLQEGLTKAGKGAEFDTIDLTIFENVAWLMLKAGGEEVGNSPDEWLESIEGIFSVYEVLPQMLELWVESSMTTSAARKK